MALGREKFEWLLKKGLRRCGDTHSVQDVVDALQDGRMQAIYNDDGLIVVQIINYPQKRVMDIFMCVGDLRAISDLKPQLVDYARDMGVDFGRAFVRPGLVDPLLKLGWKKGGTVMFF